MKNINQRALRDIYGVFRGPTDVSSIVQRSYRLYNTPIGNYMLDDVRFMLIQEFGLKELMPIALEHLRVDILAEGSYHPGDLLNSVINVPKEFWKENPSL